MLQAILYGFIFRSGIDQCKKANATVKYRQNPGHNVKDNKTIGPLEKTLGKMILNNSFRRSSFPTHPKINPNSLLFVFWYWIGIGQSQNQSMISY